MFGKKRTGSNWADQAASTQAAMRSLFDLIDPRTNVDSAKELEEITDAIARSGEWARDDEWRISTWMQTAIRPEVADGKQRFRVTVECDGQVLSCLCPSVQRAFAFYKLYAHIIIHAFYSVGPPWAE